MDLLDLTLLSWKFLIFEIHIAGKRSLIPCMCVWISRDFLSLENEIEFPTLLHRFAKAAMHYLYIMKDVFKEEKLRRKE